MRHEKLLALEWYESGHDAASNTNMLPRSTRSGCTQKCCRGRFITLNSSWNFAGRIVSFLSYQARALAVPKEAPLIMLVPKEAPLIMLEAPLIMLVGASVCAC